MHRLSYKWCSVGYKSAWLSCNQQLGSVTWVGWDTSHSAQQQTTTWVSHQWLGCSKCDCYLHGSVTWYTTPAIAWPSKSSSLPKAQNGLFGIEWLIMQTGFISHRWKMRSNSWRMLSFWHTGVIYRFCTDHSRKPNRICVYCFKLIFRKSANPSQPWSGLETSIP